MVQQDRAHRQAVTASLKTIASVFQDVLSGRVIAFIVDVRDAKTVSR